MNDGSIFIKTKVLARGNLNIMKSDYQNDQNISNKVVCGVFSLACLNVWYQKILSTLKTEGKKYSKLIGKIKIQYFIQY